jgi:hypothetical protein
MVRSSLPERPFDFGTKQLRGLPNLPWPAISESPNAVSLGNTTRQRPGDSRGHGPGSAKPFKVPHDALEHVEALLDNSWEWCSPASSREDGHARTARVASQQGKWPSRAVVFASGRPTSWGQPSCVVNGASDAHLTAGTGPICPVPAGLPVHLIGWGRCVSSSRGRATAVRRCTSG